MTEVVLNVSITSNISHPTGMYVESLQNYRKKREMRITRKTVLPVKNLR